MTPIRGFRPPRRILAIVYMNFLYKLYYIMPYDNPYNRRIAEQANKSNANYAMYNAFSNANYLRDSRPDRPDRPPLLFSTPRSYVSQVDYSGGITKKNGEGYGSGIKQLSHLGLGEDTRRFQNKGSGVYGCANMMKGNQHYEDVDSSESDSVSGDESESESGSEASESDEEQGAGLFDVLKNVGKKVGEFAWKNKGEIAKVVAPKVLEKVKEKAPIVAKALEAVKAVPAAKEALSKVGLGKKRAPSAWVQHCLAFAKSHSMKYRDALRSAECKSSYKKVGKGVVAVDAPPTGPELTSVAISKKGKKTLADSQFASGMEGEGKKKKRASKKSKALHAQFELPAEVNQNPLIGVPARKPGFDKSPGLYFEGSSFGCGKKKRASKKAKKEVAPVAEVAEVAVVKKKRGRKPKVAVAVEGGAVLGGEVNDVINGKRLGGKSGSALLKKGKGIFPAEGTFPLDVKAGEPPTEQAVIEDKPKKGQGKRGPSKWIAYVKAWATKHKCSYKQAMKDAKGSFKK